MSDKPNRIPLDTMDQTPPPPPPVTTPPEEPSGPELTPEQIETIREGINDVLRTCFDPEIPINILELGLIYSVDVSSRGAVHIKMTLTTPACPAAGSLPPEVQAKARGVPGVTGVKVDVVWEPPWDKNRMSEEARLQLGIFD
jgi:FeS assembly SUF system protein